MTPGGGSTGHVSHAHHAADCPSPLLLLRLHLSRRTAQGCDLVDACPYGLQALETVDNLFETEAMTAARLLMTGRRQAALRSEFFEDELWASIRVVPIKEKATAPLLPTALVESYVICCLK